MNVNTTCYILVLTRQHTHTHTSAEQLSFLAQDGLSPRFQLLQGDE
jgi:hypothetical protein